VAARIECRVRSHPPAPLIRQVSAAFPRDYNGTRMAPNSGLVRPSRRSLQDRRHQGIDFLVMELPGGRGHTCRKTRAAH
jgi:hypothetical protein